MTDQWITLLIQVPLVGVFVWYSLTANAKFMESLDKRDAAFEARTKAIIETMNTNNRAVLDSLAEMRREESAHDNFMREKLATRVQSRAKRDSGT